MPAKRKRGVVASLAALLAGAALPLAFAPVDLFPLAYLAPAILFLLLDGVTPGRGARLGFAFGLGMFGVGVSWVYVAIHYFGDTNVVLSALMTALFVSVLALYPAGLGALAAFVRQRCQQNGLWFLLLLPILWTGFEWFRGWFLSGFTWLDLGYSQIDTPLSAIAPVLGVYGVSLAAAICAGAVVALIRGRGPLRGAALLAMIVVWGGSGWLDRVEWVTPSGKALSVRLIQGALPQITKWDIDAIDHRLTTYAEMTLANLAGSDLVVWPENSVTVFLHRLPDYFAFLAEEVQAAGSELVVGVPVEEPDGSAYYTTMTRIGPEPQSYRKRHLVPFGEFVPLQGVLRGLVGFFDLPMSGFSRGSEQQAPLRVAGQSAAASVCYEDAFGEELLYALPEATLLINGSNNAWYGDSLAPHQHLQISRMRSRETARPLLRATTTGISALVDHRGRILQRSPQFKPAVVAGEIQPMAGATPFALYGNRWVLALMALGALLFPLACSRIRHPLQE